MCHKSCINFGQKNLSVDEIKEKRVIDIGSYNVNGSLKKTVKALYPAEYIGVDIEEGPDVDIVCDAENLAKKFGKESFDVVISTEMLEHVRDWKKVISNIKKICKSEGIILLTTRSYGFDYHAYPYDYWRYEVKDMENIFSDCEILTINDDDEKNGVLVKVKKPENFIEKDLSNYELYSIVANKRVKDIKNQDFNTIYYRCLIYNYLVSKKLTNLKIFLQNKFPFLYSVARSLYRKQKSCQENLNAE